MSMSQRAIQYLNSGMRSIPADLLPEISRIDLTDTCTYFYWSDGTGTVWDGMESKAHEIDMISN